MEDAVRFSKDTAVKKDNRRVFIVAKIVINVVIFVATEVKREGSIRVNGMEVKIKKVVKGGAKMVVNRPL